MAAYSMDLRLRVMEALAAGESADAAAERFAVHPTTVRAWRRQAAAGQTEPRKVGAKPIPTKLTAEDLERMRQAVQQRPGTTLRELVELVGGKVVQSTICRALMKLGYRYKKSRWRPENAAGPTCCGAEPTSAWPAG